MNCGCLLIHGFAGTPFEVESLAPALQNLGCTVDIPLLPGHGTSIANFRTTFFPDWLAYAQERLRRLQQKHERVIVVGFSMGGVIALRLAARHSVAGVVTLATPLYTHRILPWQVRDWKMILTPWLKYIFPEIPVKNDKKASRAIAPYQGYEGVICLPQLHSLMLGLEATRKTLNRIHCPVLVMHDLHDRVAPPESALMIAQSVKSHDVSVRYTNMQERVTSKHMLATHQETREIVADAVTEFVQRQGATSPPNGLSWQPVD